MAGPPSGRGLDAAYILSRIAEQVRQVESEWQGEVRISAAGRGRIAAFASSVISDIEGPGLPPGVDADLVVRQVGVLVPDFLEAVRAEAEATGRANGFGLPYDLPVDLIEERLPVFLAQRCHCWPQ